MLVVKTQSHVFFFFYVFETPLKDFPFYSPILLTLLFRYLQTHVRESCIYRFSQLFSKTPHMKNVFPIKL